MRPPGFWARGGGRLAPAVLAPIAAVAAAMTARRVARPGWTAPVPVICCGNATVGGAGKTPVALDLGQRLAGAGRVPAFLTRGYGGASAGTIAVDPRRHDAARVGDEALLLALVAPTYVDRDRAAGARAAVAAGADVLIMDDGLQNPTLNKTLSLLVVDGASGFGNGRVLPAGPLREPVAAAAARCAAAIVIGADTAGVCRCLPAGLPVLIATLESVLADADRGRPLIAFAGIGRPEKFFAALEAAGGVVRGRYAFPDHHPYRSADLAPILAEAGRTGATVITTAKDAVRVPTSLRPHLRVAGSRLVWRDPATLDALLGALLGAHLGRGRDG